MPEASVLPAPPSTLPAALAGKSLPRRGLERLDLLLLAVEALDLNSGEAMLWMGEQLGFSNLFPNRVALWKRRCSNPLRRTPNRDALDPGESEALIRILCAMADRVYPLLRALLSSAEPPEITHQRWGLFQSRFTELVRERLNPRRGAVQALLDPETGPSLHQELIQSLALAAGPGGVERLWASLLDAAA
ncbi:MAG: DUF3038 domain-containing protein [Cyanobacteriota bacterium]|nr:DUF3038 domain-containing protein [Cyanobacteriota bacterium]